MAVFIYAQTRGDKAGNGMTLGGVAAACIIRCGADRAPDDRPLLWRQNRDLAALVDELEARESFRRTAPPPWRPG
jgi:hypothetical protein